MSFITQIYEIRFMFACSFIDLLKLTDCNYVNFLFRFVGMSFAHRKFLGILICSWTEKEARPCRKFFADLQRDALVKTDAEFLAYTDCFIEGLREERRDGWVRISKWSSVNLHDLKISKYLK